MSPKPRLNLRNRLPNLDKVAGRNATLRVVLGRISTPGTSPEILIVEDDAVILNALAYNLSRQGFAAHKACDGAEALKLTRQLRPDLILLDLMLPGEDGIRVCEKIRKDDADTVIIMVTAKDSEEDKVQGLEAGADDYLTKPFGMKELVARINANLKRSATSPGARGKIIEGGDLARYEELYRAHKGRAAFFEAQRV